MLFLSNQTQRLVKLARSYYVGAYLNVHKIVDSKGFFIFAMTEINSS
jgi:hypothetical protein